MANLKETEFAQMGKRNLVALKQFLENELTNIEKLKKLDEFEEDFIKHGRSYFSRMEILRVLSLSHGVPYFNLEEA